MISFEGFKSTEGVPIYLQIIGYIKRGIIAGSIVNGDELPSRRVLSALLGVNPNTVQKAYHLLEEQGLIQSQSGAKSLIVLTEEARTAVRAELLEGDIRGVATALKEMGLTLDGAVELLRKFWQ